MRSAAHGWRLGVGLALTALLLVTAHPAALSRKGSAHAGGGTTRQLVVELPADAPDGAGASDVLVLGLVVPDDAVANAPQPVQSASDDGQLRDAAVFPLATPRRGPPRA